ncbi:flavoprotein [Streptomyces sp. NPDC020412]|uniref:flavoprotein n=1 Tax=Streptomyces sp. NPDC020412 TaxID=3365073 RepID=UPI00378EDD04
MTKTLYLFGSAAPPVFQVSDVVRSAQARGWDVCLGLTPTAAEWLRDELPALEELTGHPVRSRYKRPGEPDVWPKADTILFAPVTANSLSSWALCLTGTFVIGVVAEGIGKGIPIVAMPCVNSAYAAHSRVDQSIHELRDMGVTMLYGDDGFIPNPPGERRPYPWDTALTAVHATVGTPHPPTGDD